MNRLISLVFSLSFSIATLLALGAACGTPVQQDGCNVDLDCNPAGGNLFRCDAESGACLCNSDSACNAGTELCNPQGFCQERAGCFSNDDCERPRFCDVTTGECLDPRNSNKNCSVDTHCPFLYYCNGSTCQPGCQDSSDCPLGFGCVMDTCVQGACNTREDCDYGERCEANNCRSAIDSQTCTDCSCPDSNPYCSNALSCMGGGGRNCLVNTSYDANDATTFPKAYCTPECLQDDDCPWGMFCAEIFGVIDTCARGATCSNGQSCHVGSEATTGYCPCTADTDCTMIGLPGPCNADGLCLSGRACGLFPNLQCSSLTH